MSAVLDAVTPLERVRLSGELAGKVKELAGVNGALQRIGIAGRIAVILRALGVVVPEAQPVATSVAVFPLAEARSSYSGISHSGTTRGNSDEADYENTISQAVAEAAPLAETDAQRAAMAAEEGAFRSEYLTQYRQLMGVRAATYSGHVAGRSGLNSRQANARNSALDNAMTRFYAWVEGQRGRIKDAVQRARSPDQLVAAQAAKQAEQDAKDAKRAEKDQKSVAFMVKLLSFKTGDSFEVGTSIIKKISKDRSGNPSKMTFVYADGSAPFDDKIDILRVLYRGDKEAMSRDVASARAQMDGPQPKLPATETPEFKRWFGKSIAVNDDGAPQVMYHGSYRDVTEFDRLASTQWRAASMDTVGIWLTDNPGKGGAETYASGEGAAIYPMYLRMERPKVYDSFRAFLSEMHEAEGRSLADQTTVGLGSTEGLRKKLKGQGYDGIAFTKTSNQALHDEVEELRESVKRANAEYLAAADEFAARGLEMTRKDGAPYQAKIDRIVATLKQKSQEAFGENQGSTEFDHQYVWVVFESNQIKSAVGNSGAFSNDSNSIIDSV